MDKRPSSVTVIGVILIVFGGLGLLSSLAFFALKDNPMVQQIMSQAQAQMTVPMSVQIAISLVGSLISIGCGIAVMMRQGWAVYLLTAWALAIIAYGLYASPSLFGILGGLIYWGLILGFLYIPANRAWFAGKSAAT